jgi:micrococcal nuclease
MRSRVITIFLAFLVAAPALAEAPKPPRPPAGREVLPGPVKAEVLKVLDGDTLTVRARIWVGQDLEISVRVAGIDTPELRARCDRERILARQARDAVRAAVVSGRVRLFDVKYGKYAGRVLARVEAEDGRDIAKLLTDAGLARPYDGGKRSGWCG